ncbi:hypothetical protein V8C44DRAFT_353322 [Trichoderma aethiopicum]
MVFSRGRSYSNAPPEAPSCGFGADLNGTSGNIWLLDCFGNFEAQRLPLCQLELLGCWAWVHVQSLRRRVRGRLLGKLMRLACGWERQTLGVGKPRRLLHHSMW